MINLNVLYLCLVVKSDAVLGAKGGSVCPRHLFGAKFNTRKYAVRTHYCPIGLVAKVTIVQKQFSDEFKTVV